MRTRASAKLGIPQEKLQLFWHGTELSLAEDATTLLEKNLHTGFSLLGYDTTVEPVYWPAVRKNEQGLLTVHT